MRRAMRIVGLALVVLLSVAALPLLPDLRPSGEADRAAWRADLHRLEQHLAVAYANFEWSAAANRLDLAALHRSTDSTLAAAPNRRAARKAVRALIAAFDDGHLRASPPTHPLAVLAERGWRGPGGAIARSARAASACRRMGFEDRSGEFDVAFDDVPGYVPVASAPFRAGVVPLPDGKKLGVVRVAHFGEDGFAAVCEAAWDARPAAAPPCADACRDTLWAEVSDRLLASLAETVGRLSRAGSSALLVDVTGNGGGTDLADAMARELTPLPLRGAQMGFVRHPHWAGRFRADDSTLSAELERRDLTAEQRTLLADGRARLVDLLAEAERRCDGAAEWSGRAPACSPLARDSAYTTGLLRYADREALTGLRSAGILFGPSQYHYREGAWTGPLLVLMDGASASATEQFAALLKDNGVATLIGSRSMGAGCGYTYGGIRLELEAIGLTLRAPDCARLRASGENERSGVSPDLPVEWEARESRLARAHHVIEAITAPHTAAPR